MHIKGDNLIEVEKIKKKLSDSTAHTIDIDKVYERNEISFKELKTHTQPILSENEELND